MAEISDTTLYIAAGAVLLPKLVEMAFGAVKWSAARNVKNADDAQEAVKEELKALSDRVDKNERAVDRLTASHDSHKESMNTAMGSIDGRRTLRRVLRRSSRQGCWGNILFIFNILSETNGRRG